MMALPNGSNYVGILRKRSTSGMEGEFHLAKDDQILWSTVQGTNCARVHPSPGIQLAERLASRVNCASDEARSEVTETLGAFPNRLTQLGDNAALPNTLASSLSDSVAAIDSQKDSIQECQTNNIRKNFNVTSMTRWRQDHRRGFSFLPGDDSVKTMSPRGHKDIESGERVSTPLPGYRNEESGCDGVDETSKDISAPRLAPSSKPYQRLMKSVVVPAVQTATTRVQRDDTSKNVLTTIRGSSGRTSTSSRRDSVGSNIETSSLRESRKLSGNNYFAIAAARAAKNSQTS